MPRIAKVSPTPGPGVPPSTAGVGEQDNTVKGTMTFTVAFEIPVSDDGVANVDMQEVHDEAWQRLTREIMVNGFLVDCPNCETVIPCHTGNARALPQPVEPFYINDEEE